MASGGRKKDSGPSLWGVLGGLAGGLALGGLVYGAAKLVEALNQDEEPDKTKVKDEEESSFCAAKQIDDSSDEYEEDSDYEERGAYGTSYHGNSNVFAYHGDVASMATGTYCQNPNIPTTASWEWPPVVESDIETGGGPTPLKGRNLLEQLNDYLVNYVNISPNEYSKALMIVEETETQLARIFRRTHLPFDQFKHTVAGNGFDGLQITQPDTFDVCLPLKLNPDNWELVNGAETSFHTPGYFLVKRIGWETCHFGGSEWDRYLDGTYLSPLKLCKYLHGVLQFGLDEVESIQDCSMSNHMLSVFVHCSGLGFDTLRINIIPEITIGDISIVSIAHPLLRPYKMAGLRNLWQQSFADQELNIVQAFEGCQKDCLKIVKAMSLHDDSHFHEIEPYVLKTVLFHLSFQEDVWDDETLAERVIDMLMALRDYLDQGHLPHYFKPSIDLFENKTDVFKNSLRVHIQEICEKNQISSLLKRK